MDKLFLLILSWSYKSTAFGASDLLILQNINFISEIVVVCRKIITVQFVIDCCTS